jgi:pyrrolidone-carboxylate peptidase
MVREQSTIAPKNAHIPHQSRGIKPAFTLSQQIQQGLSSPAQPLDTDLKQDFESRFGAVWTDLGAHRTLREPRQALFKATDFNAADNRYEQQAETIGAAALKQAQPALRSGENRRTVDFSQVRIHHDNAAVASAQALGAQAYTVGHHIVFGRTNPVFSEGTQRQVLAHELTHVLQQRHDPHLPAQVFCRGGTLGGFFRNLGRGIQSIFTDESDYADEDLLAYLRILDTSGDIEDDYDSDNKARFVVSRWNRQHPAFVLTTRLKILLIREMLSGVTWDADENAILQLMQGSNDSEIRDMLNQIGEQTLRDKFDGAEAETLDALIHAARRRIQEGQAETAPPPEADTGIERRLFEYLRYLDVHDEIANQPDSHVNARAVIRRWQQHDERFYLPVRRMELLLSELLHGTPSAEDAQAALELLHGASTTDMQHIIDTLGESALTSPLSGDARMEMQQVIDNWRAQHTQATTHTGPRGRINLIEVSQEIPQTVAVHFANGDTVSDICSTGKGHCCVAQNDAQGAACSATQSAQSGSGCTPVGDFTVAKKIPRTGGGVELWTEFVDNRDIALHDYDPRVDGTPLSHGCVRLHRPTAQLIYDNSVKDRTRVRVRGLARPRCNWPALQAEWSGDFATAGSTPNDGEPAPVRARQQRNIDETREKLRESLDVDDEQLTAEIARLQQETGGIPFAGSIWYSRSRRVESLRSIQPVADAIPRCVATMTVEEERLAQAAPTAMLQTSGYDTLVNNFRSALQAATTRTAAETVVRDHGRGLWEHATASAQTQATRNEDRPLYWARLAMAQVIRQWEPRWFRLRPGPGSSVDDIRREKTRCLVLLESASRGMLTAQFAEAGAKHILISGFDPFGLHEHIQRANPSGAAVLSLDNQVLSHNGQRAEVQGVIFPVRFEDFNRGVVEDFFGPYINSPTPPDMIMTISQGGGSEFEVEQFAGRRRSSGSYPGNVGETSGGTMLRPVAAPGLAPGPEFLQTTLPAQQIRASLGRTTPLPGETEFTRIRPGETRPLPATSGQPESGAIAVRGSGGGYLSNEIFYRVSLLRHTSGRAIPVGHLHTPYLRAPETSADFESSRNAIVQRVRFILENAIEYI